MEQRSTSFTRSGLTVQPTVGGQQQCLPVSLLPLMTLCMLLEALKVMHVALVVAQRLTDLCI